MSIEQQLADAQSIATQDAPPAAPLAVATPGQPMGLMSTLAAVSQSSDSYLKVQQSGFQVAKERVAKKSFKATIIPSQIKPSMAIRYDNAGNTVYARTYDGMVSDDGKPWASVVSAAEAITGSKITPYASFALNFTLAEDVNDKAKVGNTVGYSTPWSAGATCKTLVEDMIADGISPESHNDPVNVKVSYELKTNSRNQDYAILVMEYLGK